MVANALLIEPEETTREAASELLQANGFDVTEAAHWPDDAESLISNTTQFVLVDAETIETRQDILEKIRNIDASLPVFVFGAGLSFATSHAALKAGNVMYTYNYDDAIEAAVRRLSATLKRVSAWKGPEGQLRDELLFAEPAKATETITALHDPDTGRIDALKIADYLGVPLAFMATALKRNYSTVAKTPAAESLQGPLQDFKRIIEVLQHVLGDRVSVRSWMNTPHPDLAWRTPRSVLQEGNADAVRGLIDSGLSGNLT
jgi:CheY-like chemotaxis protein